MKKCINYAICYAVLAMAGGVFYREFTKYNGFTGDTALGKVHTHFFLLGMFMYLIIALFMRDRDFSDTKTFKVFRVVYNIGVPLTGVMMIVRGVLDVTADSLSKGVNAAISGVAGIGHILTGAGLVLLLISLRQNCRADNSLST